MLRPFLALLLAPLLGCSNEPQETARKIINLNGRALGTTWMVEVHSTEPVDLEVLRHAIAGEIEQNEKILSHWRPDAELYRLNETFTTEAIAVHSLLHELLVHAREINEQTNGAFDPTIAPLVNLWGFGPVSTDRLRIPREEEIERTLGQVGMEQLEVMDNHMARKTRPDLQIDLSGSAKGKIVDQVCDLLDRLGHADYLVEIGGELRARGNGKDGSGWKVGLEDGSGKGTESLRSISLHDSAVATSGTYRQNKPVPASAKPASHLIDPRTGRPVNHDLLAVSVLAPTAMEADAWATALLVLGLDAGLQLAERENLAALFVERDPSGIKARTTANFPR